MEFSKQDKTIIANAMYSIVYTLEGAEAVLWAVNEVYFHDDQEDIPARAAETLGKLLRVYLGEVHDAIQDYKQIVGER